MPVSAMQEVYHSLFDQLVEQSGRWRVEALGIRFGGDTPESVGTRPDYVFRVVIAAMGRIAIIEDRRNLRWGAFRVRSMKFLHPEGVLRWAERTDAIYRLTAGERRR